MGIRDYQGNPVSGGSSDFGVADYGLFTEPDGSSAPPWRESSRDGSESMT